MRRLVIALAVLAASAVQAMAHPPPPPPPPPEGEMSREDILTERSCPPGADIAKPVAIDVVTQREGPKRLGGKKGQVDRLKMLWGQAVTSKDPRLAGVVGLVFDPQLGLVAATRGRNWVVFDLVGRDLGDLRGVQVAPMVGAPSAPTAFRDNGAAWVVAYDGGRTIARHQVKRCGLAAGAVPLLSADTPVEGIASLYFSSLLLAGNGAKGRAMNGVTRLPDQAGTVALGERELMDIDGYRLVDVAHRSWFTTNDLIGLWRPVRGREQTIITTFDLPQYGEFPTAAKRSFRRLAILPVGLSAAAVLYLETRTILFVATDAKPGQPTWLFAFELTGDPAANR